MRLAVFIAIAALALAAPAVAAAPKTFKATLTAATHTPTADNKTHWPYRVKLTDLKGKPLAGRITVAIVDPLGTVHPVQFGANTKYVTNWPFKGVFKDWVLWPPDSAVGVVLKFRATVTTAKGKAVLIYLVKPHA
jgi:hypothetical protein